MNKTNIVSARHLIRSKGYDLDSINKAAVMTSIYNDGLKLEALELANVFNDTLKKFNSKIEDKLGKGIKQGFRNIRISTTNNIGNDIAWLNYLNDNG